MLSTGSVLRVEIVVGKCAGVVNDLDEDLSSLKEEIRVRGVAVIRGVVPEDEARAYKGRIEEYIRNNPHTKGRSSLCHIKTVQPNH